MLKAGRTQTKPILTISHLAGPHLSKACRFGHKDFVFLYILVAGRKEHQEAWWKKKPPGHQRCDRTNRDRQRLLRKICLRSIFRIALLIFQHPRMGPPSAFRFKIKPYSANRRHNLVGELCVWSGVCLSLSPLPSLRFGLVRLDSLDLRRKEVGELGRGRPIRVACYEIISLLFFCAAAVAAVGRPLRRVATESSRESAEPTRRGLTLNHMLNPSSAWQ